MYSYLETDEHYEDSAKKRYEKFLADNIKKNARRPFIIAMLLMAACFGTYIGYDLVYKPHSIEYIFGKYYKIYDVNADQTSNIQAINSYKGKNFKKAAELFLEASKEDNFKIQHNFYLATSYMQCNKNFKAINVYKEILSSKDNSYYDDASWYLGLCYLKEYKIDSARVQFKKLADGQGEYTQQALEILNLLEKFNN